MRLTTGAVVSNELEGGLVPCTIASDGVRLQAWAGQSRGPTVVFVHGFPDTHDVWQPVNSRLAESFHCIVYDVRGAGASTAPLLREGYHLRHLLTDLVAVLDELAADRRVHLVGHDWGSVQLWDAVLRESSDARLTGRIASYTSISGPALQHVSAFSEAARRGDWRRKREGLKQLMRSWYVFAFQVPVLPEAAIKVGTRRLLAAGRLSRFGLTLTDDAVHGLELYRANVRHVEHIPGGPRTTLPVQLVVPLRDSFVTPAVTGEVGRFVPRLTRVEIDAGHWVPLTSPTLLATLIADFVHSHE